jgi:hypothetical protein
LTSIGSTGKDAVDPNRNETNEGKAMMIGEIDVEEFFQAYLEAALWSSTGDDDEPLDRKYTVSSIPKRVQRQMRRECVCFIRDAKHLLTEENFLSFFARLSLSERAGHDFWLTRNGHGAGFWDGDWASDVGTKLTDMANVWGTVDLYEHRKRVYA